MSADLPYAGLRFFFLGLLALPLVVWGIERAIRGRLRASLGEGESLHGRDYYLGYTVGRHLRAEDVEGILRLLRRESYHIQLYKDNGGEKVFVARRLPTSPRTKNHELEAGLLSGTLHRALQTRFEVEEERCVERGDGYCKFVAVKG